jgi:hypothetical protein
MWRGRGRRLGIGDSNTKSVPMMTAEGSPSSCDMLSAMSSSPQSASVWSTFCKCEQALHGSTRNALWHNAQNGPHAIMFGHICLPTALETGETINNNKIKEKQCGTTLLYLIFFIASKRSN